MTLLRRSVLMNTPPPSQNVPAANVVRAAGILEAAQAETKPSKLDILLQWVNSDATFQEYINLLNYWYPLEDEA